MSNPQNGDASEEVNEDNGADHQGAPAATVIDLAARTLSGDLRDHFIDLFRGMKNPWYLLNEIEQTRVAEDIGDACREAIRKAVVMIAADDFPTITATLSDVKIKKDGIEGKLGLGRYDPERHLLFDAAGGEVLMILADARRYIAARGLARVDKQQPDLPLDGEATDDPGEAEMLADGDAYARQTGREDGRLGVRDRADRYPSGAPGRGDYELGHAEGHRELAAYRSGFAASADFGIEAENPNEEGTPEHAAWEAGWAASRDASGEDEPPTQATRRGPGRKPPEDRPGA